MRLPVEVFGLQEQHGIIRADGGAQQSVGVKRRGRHHHPQAGQMSEDRFARLAVIDRPPCQITPNGCPNDHGAGEAVIGPPAQRAELVANLHHCRPDIVKKLDLDDGLQAPSRHTHRPADNAGLGKLRVKATGAAEMPLQTVGGFENSAFAFHFG